jgi:outer membrane protein assembly factor BamB
VRFTSIVILALCGLPLSARSGSADDWPRWRGPDGSAVSDQAPLPLKWGPTENVRWKTAVPGEGFSSPIVWKDRIFCTSAFGRGRRRAVHCLDRDTGKILWTREIQDAAPEVTSAMTGHAAATPVTDGKRVVAFFGNAGAVCYDFQGKQLWHRSLGEFDSELGLASSPILDRNRVILVCDHDGDRFSTFDSFLIALDVKMGQTVWKTERRGLYRSWSTPIVIPRGDNKRELVVNGQDAVRAYDPETGKPLWHLAGMTPWVTPSPVFGQGLIVAASGKNGPTLAVRPGGMGDVSKTHLAWRHNTGGPYVCSPVLYRDEVYVIAEQGVLRCYAARTGKLAYQERLRGKFTGSPVAGDGKIFITNEEGATFVVEAGRRYRLLSKNDMKEYCLASPALADGQFFLRTEKHLYCICLAAARRTELMKP